jgi:DnaJ-class molecular chaperone
MDKKCPDCNGQGGFEEGGGDGKDIPEWVECPSCEGSGTSEVASVTHWAEVPALPPSN